MQNTLIPKNYLSLFRDFDDDSFFSNASSVSFSPRTNIVEKEKEFLLSLELPSLNPEDVDITLKNNYLTVSGEKQNKSETTENGYTHYESRYGKFSRSWQLANNVKSENISAKIKNGMLYITVPKHPEAIEKQTVKKIAIEKS